MANLLAVISIMMLPKNMSMKIGHNLNSSELHCSCTNVQCHFTLVSHDLVYAISELKARWEYYEKNNVHITSGYRCAEKNKSLRGSSDTSNHMKGLAIDVNLFKIKKLFWDDFIKMCDDIFDFIIVNKERGYIHCQLNR